ncbi:MAG: CHAT domain-containing protein [Desulfobacteraceae bacterium]|nr:CHAT domain-containing protein [Desulfobacteraceae bacterium]
MYCGKAGEEGTEECFQSFAEYSDHLSDSVRKTAGDSDAVFGWLEICGYSDRYGSDQKQSEQICRIFQKIRACRIKSWTARLYRWFIEPIEPELISRNIDTLVIMPDGELWSVPFAAFYDGKQFLIEKYALAVLPAIGLTEFDKSGKDEESALMAGLSIEQDGFEALANVEKELSDIKSVMGGRLLMNQEYTSVNLEAEFRRQEYAHLVMSTHGVFGGSPQDTYLLAYGSRLTMNDLERLIGLGQFRETPLDLLTLSACETALGDERAMLGLGGIAVKAGAKTALATLWKVSDDSTSVLTREFYRQLKTRKVSKAQALRNAQMKLIADSRYEHPFSGRRFC